MRHDPAIASIVIMLRELKMHGMAQAVAELAEQGAPAFDAAQPILSQLLKAETAELECSGVPGIPTPLNQWSSAYLYVPLGIASWQNIGFISVRYERRKCNIGNPGGDRS